MKTIKEIIINHLTSQKYDGLFNQQKHCACLIEKLIPCNNVCTSCTAGYKTFDNGADFTVSLSRED